MTDFLFLPLKPALLKSVAAADYVQMTPVQAATLPAILAGQDVLAQARTGSGKTAAFALGVLSALDVGESDLQALVVCPTRELAEQVSGEIRRLGALLPNLKVLTLCGGTAIRSHLKSLARPPHIAVGTPGRLLDLINREALSLARLKVLVLDEADRMLDMGFSEDIASIVATAPSVRQTLLFSATYPAAVREVGKRYQHDALDVIAADAPDEQVIVQQFFAVESGQKLSTLKTLLAQKRPISTVVFCNTRKATRELAAALKAAGHAALALHGELEQRERDEVLVQFANHSATVLVATEVAARGLDIKELALVVNFDMANSADNHLHRIGRTGRAGHAGRAISLCDERERRRLIPAIEQSLGHSVDWHKVNTSSERKPVEAEMVTLAIDGGRQDKLRAGDLLGALTGAAGLAGEAVGKIDIFPKRTFVAVRCSFFRQAIEGLRNGKIKGRRFRVWKLA